MPACPHCEAPHTAQVLVGETMETAEWVCDECALPHEASS